jgi:hypothetical protein
MRGVERLQHVVAGGGEEPGLERFASSAFSFAALSSMFDCSSRRSVACNSSVRLRTLFSSEMAVWNNEKALPC